MSKKKKQRSNSKPNISKKSQTTSPTKKVVKTNPNQTQKAGGVKKPTAEELKTRKIAYIIGSIFTAVIVIIILVSVPWGGDKTVIRRQYDTLNDNSHVYETIKMDKLKEFIGNGETFLLYIGSPRFASSNQFVYEADKVAKEFEVTTIYYLNTSKMLEDDFLYLLEISGIDYLNSSVNYFPSMIEITNGEVFEMSYLYNEDHTYGGIINYYELLHQFFTNVFGWS